MKVFAHARSIESHCEFRQFARAAALVFPLWKVNQEWICLPPSVSGGSFFSCHLTDVPKITCNKSDCPDLSGPHGGEAAAVSGQQRLITHTHLCLCQ